MPRAAPVISATGFFVGSLICESPFCRKHPRKPCPCTACSSDLGACVFARPSEDSQVRKTGMEMRRVLLLVISLAAGGCNRYYTASSDFNVASGVTDCKTLCSSWGMEMFGLDHARLEQRLHLP